MFYIMEPNKSEESGEMYSPDEQRKYVPEVGVPSFSIQGLSDTLIALDLEVTMVQPLQEEYAVLLEVTIQGVHTLLHSPGMRALSCMF